MGGLIERCLGPMDDRASEGGGWKFWGLVACDRHAAIDAGGVIALRIASRGTDACLRGVSKPSVGRCESTDFGGVMLRRPEGGESSDTATWIDRCHSAPALPDPPRHAVIDGGGEISLGAMLWGHEEGNDSLGPWGAWRV